MQWFKAFFNFYLNASIHVALVAISFVLITAFEFEIKPSYEFVAFVFFATILAYNFVKYYGVYKSHFQKFTNKIALISAVSIISLFGMIYSSYFLKLNTLLFAFLLVLITMLYAMPFLPQKRMLFLISNLRNTAGIKVYIIASVWAGVGVVLPLIESKTGLTGHIVLTIVQRFVLVIVLMLPFEIRDLQFDDLKLETIPQKIGVKATKALGFTLIAVIAALEYIKGNQPNMHAISLLMILCVTAFLLRFMNVNRHWYYTAFWVESIPIIWLLLLVLL